MLALNLPPPTVALDAPGSTASMERPLSLQLAAVTFPDGAAIGQNDAAKAGVFVYRTLAAGGPEELWNEALKTWQAPPTELGTLDPLPFLFQAGEPSPWRGTLVAAGQKDQANQPRFAPANGGFPSYRARAFMRALQQGTEHIGVSPPTADFQFASELERARFAVVFDTPSTRAPQATKTRLLLKAASLAPASFVELRSSGGHEVEIATCDASGAVVASIILASSGEIRLRPAAGAKVVVAGDLECERLTYLNHLGVKQVLP